MLFFNVAKMYEERSIYLFLRNISILIYFIRSKKFLNYVHIIIQITNLDLIELIIT